MIGHERHRCRRRRRLVRVERQRLAVPRIDRPRPRRARTRRTSRSSARRTSAATCRTRASSATCSTRSSRTTAGSTAGTTAAGRLGGYYGGAGRSWRRGAGKRRRRRVSYGYGTNPVPMQVDRSSVSFANGVVTPVGYQQFPGRAASSTSRRTRSCSPTRSAQRTSKNGNAAGADETCSTSTSATREARSAARLDHRERRGHGWGPDNGRWNLDFADGVHAHAIGCGEPVLRRLHRHVHPLDGRLHEPGRPRRRLELPIANLGWSRRGALQRDDACTSRRRTTIRHRRRDAALDLRPRRTPPPRCSPGTTQLPGRLWLYVPDGTKLFVGIGNTNATGDSDQVSRCSTST